MKRHLRTGSGSRGLGGGLNLSEPERLLPPNQTPFCRNFSFHRGSALTAGGAIKFNNQVAPKAGIQTRTPGGGAKLCYEPSRSMPVRGYAYFPWNPSTDIGPPRVLLEGPGTTDDQRYHSHRGVSFQKNIGFRIPEDVSLFESPTLGAESPTEGTPLSGAILSSNSPRSATAEAAHTDPVTADITSEMLPRGSEGFLANQGLAETATIVSTMAKRTASMEATNDSPTAGRDEPAGRPTLPSRPLESEILEIDLFDPFYYGTDPQQYIRAGIQVGGQLDSGLQIKKTISGAFTLDPRLLPWPTGPTGRRAIRFTWSGPGKGVIQPSLNGSTFAVASRQPVAEDQPGQYTGVEWVEFKNLELHLSTALPEADFISSNSAFQTGAMVNGLLMWWEDCIWDGADVDGVIEQTGFDGANTYQNSSVFIRHSVIRCGKQREHTYYGRGWAKGWSGEDPYLFWIDSYLGRTGSQNSKALQRPNTTSVSGWGFDPGSASDWGKNAFRAHGKGNPYVGGATIAYFRCIMEESGSHLAFNPKFGFDTHGGRGQGCIIHEGACAKLLWIEDCLLSIPALDPLAASVGSIGPGVVIGVDAAKQMYPYVGLSPDGIAQGPYFGPILPAPTIAGRFYNPSAGAVSIRPSITRTVIYNTDCWAKHGSAGAAVLRYVEQKASFPWVIPGTLEVWNSTFWGPGKIGVKEDVDIDGMLWKDNHSAEAIARANLRGIPTGSLTEAVFNDDLLPLSLDRYWGIIPPPSTQAVMGSGPPGPTGDWGLPLGYDEAFESTCLILQKGGDRQANLSWALGLVNVGNNGEELGLDDVQRVSNYALVFMWMDAPTFALEQTGTDDFMSPAMMRYALGTEANIDLNGLPCTLALRAILIPYYVEPGQDYRVSVALKMDTGGVTYGGGSTWSSAWNSDGAFTVTVQRGYDEPRVFTDDGGEMISWKGPEDSIDYLKKYGIRYHAKDAEFGGLGMRRHINDDENNPGLPGHFIPYGHDQAPLENAGNRLVKRADIDSTDLFPGWTLTAQHFGAGDSFLTFNHFGLVRTGAWALGPQSYNPISAQHGAWGGAGASEQAVQATPTLYHTEGLKGYRLIATKEIKSITGTPDAAGAIFSIASMPTWVTAEIHGLPGIVPATDPFPVMIQAFRWNQHPLVLSDYRHYREPLDYADSRAKLSLRGTVDLEDPLDPGIERLTASWPLDDAGGGSLRELISNRFGYLAPFSLGVSEDGTRGGNRVFLSGEGEALCLDLSDNPIFEREFQHMLDSGTMGFGIELTLQMPEATYLASVDPPVLASWELRDPDNTGLASKPSPLMRLTLGADLDGAPSGFALQMDTGSDQQATGLQTIISDDYGTATPWGVEGEWIGKTIALQFGLQPTGDAEDEYWAYIAASPKTDLKPEAGDLSRSEYVVRTKLTEVDKKGLLRSFITIGGQLDPGSAGYDTNNVRVILDEVRISAAPMPGAWPETMTPIVGGSPIEVGTNTARDGKLNGSNSLPARELSREEILRPLGDGVRAANVTDGDPSVLAPTGQAFFTASASDTLEAILGTFLLVRGDVHEIKKDETVGETQEEFYAIKDVEADGDNLLLHTPFHDSSRRNASAASFRLVGYTAFGTDISGQMLTLGSGTSFVPAVTKAEDALISDGWWTNLAPVTGNFQVRLFSPLASGSLRDVVPLWTRGTQYPKKNPVLGVSSIGETPFFTTQGCLYRGDDRWREDGPNETYTRSLEFLLRLHPRANVGRPLHEDYAILPAAGVRLGSGQGTIPAVSDNVAVYDAWVWVDELLDYQTIFYLGDTHTRPSQYIDVRGLNCWNRLRNGRPELVVGSTASATPAAPEGGLFVASGSSTVRRASWNHIRWYMLAENGVLKEPVLCINGKQVPSTVNVTDSAAEVAAVTDGWLRLNTIPQDASQVLLVGCARDSMLFPSDDPAFVPGKAGGPLTRANRIHGFMHGLGGKLCGLVVADTDEEIPASFDFDHNEIDYAGLLTAILNAPMQEGIGHRISNLADTVSFGGVIYSHPAVSVHHEMGREEHRSSFAAFDNRLYVANGGRVVYTDRAGRSKFSGVYRPNTAAKFDIERKPLWVPNVDGADPVEAAAAGAGTQINHYDGFGNTYLEQEFHEDMLWEKDDATGEYGIFAFKGYWKPRDVTGRIPLFTTRDGKDSGSMFVESVDGVLRCGWYDTYLKKQVYVETSAPVFEAGSWHYVHVRMRFPQQDGDGGGNWSDSVWDAANKTSTRDLVVVRRFMLEGVALGQTNYPTFYAKYGIETAISFTTDNHGSVPGTTATGLVTVATLTYDGAGDTITATSGAPFHQDMRGAYWQWGTGSSETGKLFRIKTVLSATQIVVRTLQDGVPAFAETAQPGGAFMGIALVPSSDYDAATSPDSTPYPVRYFGTQMAGATLSGESAASGEFASFGVVVIKTTTGTGVEVFETGAKTDEIERGGDNFDGSILVGGEPGELHFDGTAVWSVVDGRPYAGASAASTQPNQELEVAMDTEAATTAQSAFWKYVQDPGQIYGEFTCRIAFVDLDQGVISALGPPLRIEPSLEDASNPSGSTRLVLSNLPVSREAGTVGRYVYLTAPGGAAFHLVRIVPDNSSTTVSIPLVVEEIQRGEPARWDASIPPFCRFVTVVGEHLVYANLTFPEAVDGFRWSTAFQPAQVPPANFARFNTGQGREITAVGSVRGYLVCTKRNSAHRALLSNAAQVEDLAGDNGCVAPESVVSLDNMLIWLSDLGWVVYRGTGIPQWIGEQVEDVFNDIEPSRVKVDKRYIAESSAAVNYGIHTIELAVRLEGEDHMRHRLTLGMDFLQGGPVAQRETIRHGLLEGPNLTSLGTVDRQGGGARRLIGGTAEGFLVWLDRPEAVAEMMGPARLTWGDLMVTAATGATATLIPIKAGLVDQALEGPRGSVLAVPGQDDEVRVVVGQASNALLLDRASAVVPAEDDALYLGSPKAHWETGWLDLGAWNIDKVASVLDLEFEGSTGQVYVRLYKDLNLSEEWAYAVPGYGDTVAGALVVEVEDGWAQLDVTAIGATRYLKVVMFQGGEDVDQKLELVALGVRGRDADLHG